MNRTDCKLERISNVSIGLILLGVSFLFLLTAITVLPVLGLLIAVPLFILAVIFLVAPRSKACQVIVQKTRGALDS